MKVWVRIHYIGAGAVIRPHAVNRDGVIACGALRTCVPRVGPACCSWSIVQEVDADLLDCAECRHHLDQQQPIPGGWLDQRCRCGDAWRLHWSANGGGWSGCCAAMASGSRSEGGLYESVDECDCEGFHAALRRVEGGGSMDQSELLQEFVEVARDLRTRWASSEIGPAVTQLGELVDLYDADACLRCTDRRDEHGVEEGDAERPGETIVTTACAVGDAERHCGCDRFADPRLPAD
jgi:hypothetical protein